MGNGLARKFPTGLVDFDQMATASSFLVSLSRSPESDEEGLRGQKNVHVHADVSLSLSAWQPGSSCGGGGGVMREEGRERERAIVKAPRSTDQGHLKTRKKGNANGEKIRATGSKKGLRSDQELQKTESIDIKRGRRPPGTLQMSKRDTKVVARRRTAAEEAVRRRPRRPGTAEIIGRRGLFRRERGIPSRSQEE